MTDRSIDRSIESANVTGTFMDHRAAIKELASKVVYIYLYTDIDTDIDIDT